MQALRLEAKRLLTVQTPKSRGCAKFEETSSLKKVARKLRMRGSRGILKTCGSTLKQFLGLSAAMMC